MAWFRVKDYCYLSFDNAEERILDLEELAKLASNYSTIKEFLLDFSSFEEFKGETLLGSYEKGETLVLSTIHQAKGLEWDVVFIIGFCEYGFFYEWFLLQWCYEDDIVL